MMQNLLIPSLNPVPGVKKQSGNLRWVIYAFMKIKSIVASNVGAVDLRIRISIRLDIQGSAITYFSAFCLLKRNQKGIWFISLLFLKYLIQIARCTALCDALIQIDAILIGVIVSIQVKID